MNRNNIWVHVSLAVVLVTIAAVIGQIDRWRSALKTPLVQRVSVTNVKPNPIKTKGSDGNPEVLVRFKPGTTLEMIRALAVQNHDQVVDDIESVNGLVAIDDLDDADPQMVANQYAAMSNVSYAEPKQSFNLTTRRRATKASTVTRILMKPVYQMIRSLPTSGRFTIKVRKAARSGPTLTR
jgi:hypothetical protein